MAQGVTIDFNANLSRFSGAVDKAVADLSKFQSNSERIAASVGTAFKGLGVAAGAVGFAGVIRSAIDAADELGKLSQKLGINVEMLAGYQHAADLSGLSAEAFGAGVRNLSKYMTENGAALRAAGITATDANGALMQLADKFQTMEDGPKKTAIALKLLGKSGNELIPLLNGGGKALADLVAEGQRLNPVTAESAKQAESFNDNLARIQKSAGTLGVQLANVLLPTLSDIAAEMEKGTRQGGLFTSMLNGMGTAIRGALGKATSPMGKIAEEIGDINRQLDGMDQRIANFGTPRNRGQELNLLGLQQARKDLLRRRDALSGEAIGLNDSEAPAKKTKGDGGLGALVGPSEAAAKSVEVYADRINQAVASAITGSDIVKAREMADQIEALDRLFFDAGLDAEIYASAMNKLTGATSKAGVESERLNELLAATPSAELEKTRADMVILAEAMEKGSITSEQYLEAVQTRLGRVAEEAKEASNFARDLGMSFSSAFEDSIVDGKGLSEVLQGLERDVARIMVRKSITEPFGDAVSGMVASAGIGDFFKNLLSFDGGGYTGTASRSGGIDGKGGFLSVLHPQETVIDHTRGGGGSRGAAPNIVINFTNPPGIPLQGRQQGQPQWDRDQVIIGVVLDHAESNPRFRAALGLGS